MQQFPCTIKELFNSFWRNRSLTLALIKREVSSRYRGSILGILWSFLNPVFMLAVYTFVFSVIFKARWNAESNSKTEFALALFAGLIVFGLFAECINRAPKIITSNINYVKKVVFPLEILPLVSLGSAIFNMLINITVWIIFYIFCLGPPHLSILLLPVALSPLILFTIGGAWFLASLGVYLRDVSQFIGIVTSMLLYLSPVFYPTSALPHEFRFLQLCNPLTYFIESTRDILMWGKILDFKLFSIYFSVSALIAFLGFAWFQKTRKGFADVI